MHKCTLEPTLRDFADVFAREKIFLALVCLGFIRYKSNRFVLK